MISVAHHIVDSDSLELASDLVLEDVVGTESVHTDVFAHGNELRSTQIVKSDIVMEQLSNSDDIGIRRGFSSRSNLYISLDTLRGVLES